MNDQLHLNLDFDTDAEFAVDPDSRTVTGVIVPWGKSAFSRGFSWTFPRGTFYWNDDVSRVKLTRHHDLRDVVGFATRIWEGKSGLMGSYKVRRGPIGDEVLMAAEDKVLDGLSAGIEFESSEDWDTDPETATRIAKRVRLRETTMTAIPAFDDARLTKVTAEREDDMPPEVKEKEKLDLDKAAADGGKTPITVDLVANMDAAFEKLIEKQGEQNKTLTEALSEAFAQVAEKIVPAESPRQARFQITNEPPLYRFSGPPGEYSMVKDAWHAVTSRDREAEGRLLKFQRQVSDMVRKATHDFQQGTGDLAEVIPPGYRPDLYVSELMQGRPLASGLSRGTISDATPFTVPVFESALGATADHAESVNPTPGTLALTQRTVQPTAISGSLQLTREIVDSSNPAIDVIAMNAMRESYAQQTEVKIYAMLNGVNGAGHADAQTHAPVDLALGPALIDVVRERLARYPFVRFASPSRAYLSQEATVAFATAKDLEGRHLLSSVGATNAAGVGNAVTQGWFVDGLPFVPAWAITEGIGDHGVLGWNQSDVWMWESPLLTFRFEEKIGPANIELALFGYFGSHALRPAGIFAVPST